MKDATDVVGSRTRVKVVKNKVAPPFRTAEFDIIYGEGVSSVGELVDLGVSHEILKKSGSWYGYGDIRIGQGREATKQWLRDNDNLREEIKHLVKVAMGMVMPEAISEAHQNGVIAE